MKNIKPLFTCVMWLLAALIMLHAAENKLDIPFHDLTLYGIILGCLSIVGVFVFGLQAVNCFEEWRHKKE